MGKLPETKGAVLNELGNWQAIINSEEWVAYRGLVRDHRDYLQKQSNDFLRKKEFTDAFGALRAMDDVEKILTLVTIRISDLTKQAEKG